MPVIADLRKRGITIISAMEPDLCVDDPSRKLMRQIMGAIAEDDRSMIVLKMKAARDRGALLLVSVKAESCGRSGRSCGGIESAPLRKAGSSLQAICDALNSEGVTTRYGKLWMPMTLHWRAGCVIRLPVTPRETYFVSSIEGFRNPAKFRRGVLEVLKVADVVPVEDAIGLVTAEIPRNLLGDASTTEIPYGTSAQIVE